MLISVDVIVRTRADAFRSNLLFRALDSIQGQPGVIARPIVVVNGQAFDAATVSALESRPGILLHHEQQASTTRACAAGRGLVSAPYFAFLDDDDLFVEKSLCGPLTWLENNPHCDVLITNGYFVKAGGALVESTHIENHLSRPDLSLVQENWLSPGASFFRTQSIAQAFFHIEQMHQEWTRMAYGLCAEGKIIRFLDVATALYNDTPGSMSKKPAHQKANMELLRMVYHDQRLDTDVRLKVRAKYHNALHVLAMTYWNEGNYVEAWRYHLASMKPPYLPRYLLFSRKLLWAFKSRAGPDGKS